MPAWWWLKYFLLDPWLFCRDDHRKETHTKKYRDFASGNPMQHKEAVVKTLQIRASFLSSCPWLGTDEWDHVLNDLKVNSYPGSVLKKCLDNKTKPEVSSVCIVSQRRFIVSRRRFIVSQRSFLCVSQKIGTILKSELVQTTPVKRFSTETRLTFGQM